MGAITSDFVHLPGDADPGRIEDYTRVYGDLSALGLPLPAMGPDAITRAQLLVHLQTVVGDVVGAELANDPQSRGYAGASNADAAVLFNSAAVPRRVNRVSISDPNGYAVILATNAGMQAEVVGGTDPGFQRLRNAALGVIERAVFARFRDDTITPALRGRFVRLNDAPASNQITFAVAMADAPLVGNIFDLSFFQRTMLDPRIALLAGVPYCPNALTETDVAGARS